MLQVVDNTRAIPISSGPHYRIIYVIVNGPGNVRLGDNPQVLKNDPNDGIPFNNATPASQSWIMWAGTLYAIADVQTKLSVQESGKIAQGS